MDNKVKETLVITQEECAEVIQAISKILRFGFDSRYPDEHAPSTKQELEAEVGQLLCMIDLLVEQNIVTALEVGKARQHKREKLKQWSSIFDATN